MLALLLASALIGIRTPTGNISCAATPGGTLYCELKRSSYAHAAQARCMSRSGLDWHGFELSPNGPGRLTCTGGILVVGRVRYRTLAYGSTWRYRAFTCTSRFTGLTCTNRAGHGLFLSRESYRLF
jgi:Family of unknown function (DUF6636)